MPKYLMDLMLNHRIQQEQDLNACRVIVEAIEMIIFSQHDIEMGILLTCTMSALLTGGVTYSVLEDEIKKGTITPIAFSLVHIAIWGMCMFVMGFFVN